jgi:hypothetical protein
MTAIAQVQPFKHYSTAALTALSASQCQCNLPCFAAQQPTADRLAAFMHPRAATTAIEKTIEGFIQHFTWFVSCVSLCHDRLRTTQITRWRRASTGSQSQWQGRGRNPLPSLVLTFCCCAACRCVFCASQAEFQLSPRPATSTAVWQKARLRHLLDTAMLWSIQ